MRFFFWITIELDDIPISHCGIIAVPADTQVFLEHSETKEPIGACLTSGKGRVLLINDLAFSQGSQRTCGAFMDWLAANRASKIEGSEAIPDEIPVDEQVKEDGKIKIYYTDLVKDRLDICLEFTKKIAEDMIAAFPKGSDMSWEIRLYPSCAPGGGWGPVLHVGAFMSDPKLAYALGGRMMRWLNPEQRLGDLLWDSGFAGRSIPAYFGMAAMKLLGFETEAGQVYDEIVRQFNEKDPTGKEFDISKAYEYHPKSVWILNTLTEKHGQDLFVRLARAAPEEKDPWENIPRSLFTATDIFIYYLSRGLETDLYPWFREIGTTVHPLPMHPNDSDEFKEGVHQYLENMIRDKNATASDRSGAVWALIETGDKAKKQAAGKEEQPSVEPTPALDSEDKYERLAAAMRLSRSSDSRAVSVLENLASGKDDGTLAAIAALTLVRKGITSAADRLVETARGQDYRFQLDAGYALHKIGHEGAEELSFRGLKDENGDPVVEMKVEYDARLRLFPTVAGQKVANIFSGPWSFHFPENTHVTAIGVEWVYTGPLYRRKGLSRWTMQETFAHKAARRCSCANLGTGTRNTAHAMYRSSGFVDISSDELFTKELREEKAKVVDGLVIRSYSPGDEVKMAGLANEHCSDTLYEGRRRARRPLSNTCIKIAEKDGEMLGYALASSGMSKEEAHLSEMEIFVKETDGRDDIGAALLCALHNDLVKHEFKKIVTYGPRQKFLRQLLHSFGYSSRHDGGVGMFKIINLPMLLEELSPLLSKRLKDSDYKDWHGKIGIAGQQHKATVSIEDSNVSVSEEALEDMDILISTDDDTITSIIVGAMTPFEAYLQTDLSIEPMVNNRVTKLLETLFPHIPKDG